MHVARGCSSLQAGRRRFGSRFGLLLLGLGALARRCLAGKAARLSVRSRPTASRRRACRHRGSPPTVAGSKGATDEVGDLADTSGECVPQRRDGLAQRAFGEIGQHMRVVCAGDQRVEIRVRRDTAMIFLARAESSSVVPDRCGCRVDGLVHGLHASVSSSSGTVHRTDLTAPRGNSSAFQRPGCCWLDRSVGNALLRPQDH